MRIILALARKDLRVLTRVKSALFFTFVWPIIVAVLFGLAFSGPSPTRGLQVVVVDEDKSPGSNAFLSALESSGDFLVDPATLNDAESMVRRGQRAAYIVLTPGFGAASRPMVAGPPRHVIIGNDPRRRAEASMLEGLLTKHAMADMQALLGERMTGGAGAWQPLLVSKTSVSRERTGPSNGFGVTFPQGIIWGILGCVMSFAVGLVSERVRGTYVRLQTAPITRAQILAGKALACLSVMTALQVALIALGVLAFGIKPSYGLLAIACASASLGFVGFMMMIAGLGRTEQGVGGAGWAMLMPMTLFGGGMMPQFLMPEWMQIAGNASPVKWAILAIEGAVWRGFSEAEMVLPCSVLIAFGLVCFAAGFRGLRDA